MKRAPEDWPAAFAAAAIAAACFTARPPRLVPVLLPAPRRVVRNAKPPAPFEPAHFRDALRVGAAAEEELRDAPADVPAPGDAPASVAEATTPPSGLELESERDAAADLKSAPVHDRRENPRSTPAKLGAAPARRPATAAPNAAKAPMRRNEGRAALVPRPARAFGAVRSGAGARSVAAAPGKNERGGSGRRAEPPLAPFGRARGAAGAFRGTRAPGEARPGTRESSLFAGADAPRAAVAARTRRKARRKAKPGKPPRFRPLLLSKLLGPRPLKPPPADLEPPEALANLPPLRPRLDAAGAPVPDAPPGLASIDSLDPARLHRDRRADAHWDGPQWHDGAARGLIRGGTWTWFYRDGARWWALAGEQRRTLLRHDGLWWLKERGVWFVVHDGQPWAWRSFHDWDAQGLFQPATGTEMVYSNDFSRVAVITPEEGAVVYDAASGAELARIPEDRMPPRRRPKAPRPLGPPGEVFSR